MADSVILGESDEFLRLAAIGGDLLAFSVYHLRRDPWNLRREVYDWIAENRKGVLNLPMGHGKSTTITETLPVALPCWNRDIRIIVGSEATSRAVEAVRWSRDQLELNPRIRRDFGPMRGKPWQEGKFAVAPRSPNISHPTVSAIGMDSSVLGARADVAILDDIVSKKNSQTAHQQNKTTSWVDTTIQSRIDPAAGRPFPYGGVWVIGNLFHPRDTLATLSQRKSFATLRKSAYTDPERTRVLLPELWTVDDLEERAVDMGPAAFELAYMNNPGGLADNPFRPEWFRYWTEIPSHEDGNLVKLLPPRGELQVLQGWDLAATRSETADFSVCATIGVHRRSASFYWLDIWRQRVEPYELLEAVAQQALLWKPERVAIESNGFQLYVAQGAAREHPSLMRLIYPTKTPSDRSKVDRIVSGLQPSFARRAHYFAEYGMEEAVMEIQNFPGGTNDDVPDAGDICLRDVDKGVPPRQTPVGLSIGKVI